jgi:hypothetical protein
MGEWALFEHEYSGRQTCRKQSKLVAADVYVEEEEVTPSLVARVAPSRMDRCCTAVVKNDEELTSSQRSNLQRIID